MFNLQMFGNSIRCRTQKKRGPGLFFRHDLDRSSYEAAELFLRHRVVCPSLVVGGIELLVTDRESFELNHPVQILALLPKLVLAQFHKSKRSLADINAMDCFLGSLVSFDRNTFGAKAVLPQFFFKARFLARSPEGDSPSRNQSLANHLESVP